MKTKISLIVAQYNKQLSPDNDNFFRFLVDDSKNIPGEYLSTKNEKETLQNLFDNHLNIYFDWATVSLLDFRKHLLNECEVVYCCKLFDIMGAEKRGKFVSQNSNIDLDPYYERLLSQRVRPGGYWTN
jgi:hypothetical protein